MNRIFHRLWWLLIPSFALLSCIQVSLLAEKPSEGLIEVAWVTATPEPFTVLAPSPTVRRPNPSPTLLSISSPVMPTQTQERTSTPSVTPLVIRNVEVDLCMTVSLGGDNRVLECVTDIFIHGDGRMQFGFSWTALVGAEFEVLKESDRNNRNLYLLDNLTNRYDHIDVGGAADQEVTLLNGQTARGWFLFPAAEPGVSFFVFFDDDNGVRTDPIVKVWP